jgi:PEP-CTERM motif
MLSKFSWLGIGVYAAFSLAGTLSYASSIDFSNCTQIVSSGVTCPNADAGKSQIVYSNGGLSVTATGFLNPIAPSTTNNGREDLYVKQGGAGETGLGTIIDTADHEITDMDFVNLDFSNLLAHGISSAVLTIESLQAGEEYKLCQGNLVGTIGGGCIFGAQSGSTADNTVTVSWTSATDIIGLQGYTTPGSGVIGPDVLVQGMTFTIPTPPPPPVPEPASLLLFGSGMVALAVKKMRRSDKQIEAV